MFPVEIYGSIIGFVALQDDYSHTSLKSCSLVSHTFLPLARAHLFYDITLNVSRSNGPQSLLQLLKVSRVPEIAQHVHSLNYDTANISKRLPGLTKALKAFTRLNRLAIGIYSSWVDVPFALRHVLPSLNRLELVGIQDFLFPDLAICSNLKSLTIQNVHPPKHKPITIPRQKTPLTVGRVCTDGTYMIDFSVLQTLVLTFERLFTKHDVNESKALVERCIQLTRVVVSVDPNYGATSQTLRLKGFANLIMPSLKTLPHLEFTFIESQLTEYGLATELEAISGVNVIESIEIEVFYNRNQYRGRGDEWLALGKALTKDPNAWKNLTLLSLSFDLSPSVSLNFKKALKKSPMNHFKAILASRNIQFNFNIRTL